MPEDQEQKPEKNAVLEVNTLYATLEAFIVQFSLGGEKFVEAMSDYGFFSSLQSKILRTPVLNDSPSEDGSSPEELSEAQFEGDNTMAWYMLIAKAVFALYLLSRYVPSVRVSSDIMRTANGDQYNMNEAVVPCPRLGYRDYVVSVKVDHPDNKLMKIGGVFIDGELAIKAPYDMEEYISTVINIAASNDDSSPA